MEVKPKEPRRESIALNENECPRCGAAMTGAKLTQHLKERHGISFPSVNEIAKERGKSPVTFEAELAGGKVWEQGNPLDFRNKKYMSKSEAKKESVEYSEQRGVAMDKDGNPMEIEHPQVFANKLHDNATANGHQVEYIKVQGSDNIAHLYYPGYKSSLSLWIAFVVILAAAIIAVLVTANFVAHSLYKLFLGPGGARAKIGTALIIGGLAFGGYLLYKIVSGGEEKE